MAMKEKSLDTIIRNDIVRSEDAMSIVIGDMSSSEFMSKHGFTRDMTAGYIRFYRAELRQETKHLDSIGECQLGSFMDHLFDTPKQKVPSMYDEISYDNELHRFHFAGMQDNFKGSSFALYTCECGHTLSETTLKGLKHG